MTVGEKITRLRKEQNLTQEQFAELLHVSRQSVSKWELNSAYPDTEKLIRMSRLFGCSLDYLLKDEIENTDENVASESEHARETRVRASVLTYLSFAPIFGWIAGIFSLKLQLSVVRSRKQTVLTIAGMVFSLTLTVLMILGAVLGL
ncbi:MAG: hypothetical protein CW338_12475 [Clostridiales bacterium]|nr:hypothetical protein [Clostridiales bacterium]